jgi:hypothetical protein
MFRTRSHAAYREDIVTAERPATKPLSDLPDGDLLLF